MYNSTRMWCIGWCKHFIIWILIALIFSYWKLKSLIFVCTCVCMYMLASARTHTLTIWPCLYCIFVIFFFKKKNHWKDVMWSMHSICGRRWLICSGSACWSIWYLFYWLTGKRMPFVGFSLLFTIHSLILTMPVFLCTITNLIGNLIWLWNCKLCHRLIIIQLIIFDGDSDALVKKTWWES